jgi:ABC-type nickel/cobalt efflux system permease component RcnA
MNVTAIIVAVIVVVVLVALAAWYITRQQRHQRQLREQFGPEYDHAVESYGERRQAEQALEARAERVAALHIRPLSSEESAKYGEEWRQVQTRFVDDPEHAIGEADRLCGDVMQARGYPMGDFEQRAADISVDHATVVEHYRAAHAIAVAADRGDADTEQLRQAMVHYRTLFEDLIEARQPARS